MRHVEDSRIEERRVVAKWGRVGMYTVIPNMIRVKCPPEWETSSDSERWPKLVICMFSMHMPIILAST